MDRGGESDLGGNGGDDAAAEKQAKIDETFADIISGGLDENDKERFEALAIKTNGVARTLPPAIERKEEAPKKFSILSETNKLLQITRFMFSAAKEELNRAKQEGASGDVISQRRESYEMTLSRTELLRSMVDTTDSNQTVTEIVRKIQFRISELQSGGNTTANEEAALYSDLLGFVSEYKNPENIDSYYETHKSFRDFLEQNL